MVFKASNAISLAISILATSTAHGRVFPRSIFNGDDLVLRICHLNELDTIAGYDFGGNPIYNAECTGLCPRIPRGQSGSQCSHGCAPSDYTVCDADNCFTGGESECIAQEDETGDRVCAWNSAAGTCGGCNGVPQSMCSTSIHPNCEWNPANGGSCVALGPTTSPICDSELQNCPGHEGEECPTDSPNQVTRECTVSSSRLVWRFRDQNTRAPTPPPTFPPFTPAPMPEYEIPDEELPIPDSQPPPDSGRSENRLTALLRADSPGDRTWISSFACNSDGTSCSVELSPHNAESNTRVTVEYCTALGHAITQRDPAACGTEDIENGGICNWLVTTGGRSSGCVPFWISQKTLRLRLVPTDCECI